MKIVKIHYSLLLIFIISAGSHINARYFKPAQKSTTNRQVQRRGKNKIPFFRKKAVVIGLGIIVLIGGSLYFLPKAGGNLSGPSSKPTSLAELVSQGNGIPFEGSDFVNHAVKIINNLKNKEVNVGSIMPLLKKTLLQESIDLTKKYNPEQLQCEWWPNQIEHAFIDGDKITPQNSAVILDALLTLHTELTSTKQTETILNEQGHHELTILHNLISRHGGNDKNVHEICIDYSPNCLPHINVLLKHGANPNLKGNIRIGTYIDKKENIQYDYKIKLSAIDQASGNYENTNSDNNNLDINFEERNENRKILYSEKR